MDDSQLKIYYFPVRKESAGLLCCSSGSGCDHRADEVVEFFVLYSTFAIFSLFCSCHTCSSRFLQPSLKTTLYGWSVSFVSLVIQGLLLWKQHTVFVGIAVQSYSRPIFKSWNIKLEYKISFKWYRHSVMCMLTQSWWWLCCSRANAAWMLLNKGEGGGSVSGGLQLSGSGCLSDLWGVLEHRWRDKWIPAPVLARSPLCPVQLPEPPAPEVQRSSCSCLSLCKWLSNLQEESLSF